MKPEELIELYALEEAIGFVLKGLEVDGETDLAVTLYKLFHNRVNDNDLSLDQYKTLQEAYKNPTVKKTADLPKSPFPWVADAGAGWSKK